MASNRWILLDRMGLRHVVLNRYTKLCFTRQYRTEPLDETSPDVATPHITKRNRTALSNRISPRATIWGPTAISNCIGISAVSRSVTTPLHAIEPYSTISDVSQPLRFIVFCFSCHTFYARPDLANRDCNVASSSGVNAVACTSALGKSSITGSGVRPLKARVY